MTTPITPSLGFHKKPAREFKVGTTGWTVADLADADFAARWEEGRYEIIEGVLTTMAAAYPYGNRRLQRLINLIAVHLAAGGPKGEFIPEADLALAEDRVVRVDAVLMTAEDDRRNQGEMARRGLDERFAPILVPPTLLIESVSRGHERHDRVIKRRWYAEAGVPNYWLLNSVQQTLECLVLEGTDYRVDQLGRANAELKPALFPGLVIPLSEIWT
jgi:Uma2 family endonuclease